MHLIPVSSPSIMLEMENLTALLKCKCRKMQNR